MDVVGCRMPTNRQQALADPGLEAHLREYPPGAEPPPQGFVDLPGTEAPPEGFVPFEQSVGTPRPSFTQRGPSYLGRIAELTGERWREQGSNIGNILKRVGGAAARIPTRDTPMPPISAGIPGSNILEKGLNLVRLIPHVAALEAGLAPIGAAIQTGAERLGGVSPEKSREVSNYLELATTLPMAFARTGPGLLSKALQSVGVGRPSEAAEAAARTAAMQKKYPGSVGPDLPLTTSERLASEFGDNPPREMVPLYTPPVKTGKGKGKAPKQAAPWNRLSRENAPPVSDLQDRDARALIATMGDRQTVPLETPLPPSPVTALEETLGVPLVKPKGRTKVVAPIEAVDPTVATRLTAIQSDANRSTRASGQPYGRQYGSVETEMGGQKRAIGDAEGFVDQFAPLYPELQELQGLKNVGPKAIAEAIKKDKGNKLYTMIKDASARQVEREAADEAAGAASRAALAAEEEAYIARLAAEDAGVPPVTPPVGTQPKLYKTQAEMPPTPLQAKTAQVPHEELLGGFRKPEPPSPELPLGGRVSESQPTMQTVRPGSIQEPTAASTTELGMGLPVPRKAKQASAATRSLDEIMREIETRKAAKRPIHAALRREFEKAMDVEMEARSSQSPYGKSGSFPVLMNKVYQSYANIKTGQPLTPDMQEALQVYMGTPNPTLSDITKAIEGTVQATSDAIGKDTTRGLHKLYQGGTELTAEEVTAIEKLAGEPIRARATQPLPRVTGTPNQPPKLSLPTASEEGIVELGMGLPIPKSVKDWTRRFLTGEEKPGAKAHGWLTDWTIFNRALGVDPATKKPIGDLVNNSILTTMQIEGKKNNAVGKTLLLSNRGKEAVLNEAENVNLMRVMEGKERPMNARVAEAADVLIPELAQDSAIYTKEGAQILRDAVYDTKTGATIRENQWVPYQGLKNYYPHYPDPTLIVKYSADEGAKLILRDYPKMPRATAQDIATAILAEAKGESIPQSVGQGARELLQLGQPQATHLHARSPNFTYPEEFRMRPNKAIPRYNEASATELGYLLNLGPRDAKIEQALGRARASGRSDVGVAQSAWNHLRNRAVIDPLGTTTKKVVQLGKNLTTATLLGINTAVKQTSQAGMHFFGDTRMRHSLATLGKAFTRVGKDEARGMGALIDDLRSQLELQNPIHWGILPKDTLLDKAVKHTGRLATGVVTKTGSIPMDTLWRTWSALASKRDFLAYQREAANGSSKAVAMLKRFDLTPTSPLADIERAAQKLSHRTNLRADTMTIPGVFYRDTAASLFSSLQKFNLSMVSKLRKEFVAPMAKALYAKDRAEAMYQAKRTAKFLAGMGITGEVVADTLTTIQGRSDDRPGGSLVEFIQGALNGDVSPSTAVRRFGENLVTAGTFGALQVIQGALYAQGGAREKQGRIAGAFGGAVVGSAAEAGGHVADLLTASREPNENTGISPHDRAKSNALRALLSRIPGTRPFSGMVAPKVGELLGLPKMKTPRAKVRTEAAIERATKRRDPEAVNEWAQWYRQQQ